MQSNEYNLPHEYNMKKKTIFMYHEYILDKKKQRKTLYIK